MRAKTIVLLMIVVAGSLRADAVIYTVMPGAGAFGYQFTLENTGATEGSLFDLFLSLQTRITNIDTMNIGVPVGWGVHQGGYCFLGLMSIRRIPSWSGLLTPADCMISELEPCWVGFHFGFQRLRWSDILCFERVYYFEHRSTGVSSS